MLEALGVLIQEVIEDLFVYWQNLNCPRCGGSGQAGPYREGWGSYDMICDDCGGQSASADRSFFVRGAV